MKLNITARRLSLIAALVIAIGLTACSNGTATPVITGQTPTLPPSQAATPTPTPEPDVVLLIADPNTPAELRERVSAFLVEQQAGQNFILETRETFDTSQIQSTLRIVIFLSEPEDISGTASSQPNIQFAVITSQDISPSPNLSVIRSTEFQALFLAGYLAILNAPDFRAGALLVDGMPAAPQSAEAFLNGGRYFCGRCAPVYAPIVLFPQMGLVPPNSDAAGWKTAFDALNQSGLEMLYLPAEGLQPDFLAYLAGTNVKIISSAPPPAGSENLWVAVVRTDPLTALQELWPDLLNGSGGKSVTAPISISDVNPANLSIGRQQLAERLIPDLLSGAVSPFTVP